MDEPIWPMFDNSSWVTHRLSSTSNSTNTLPTIALSQAGKSVTLAGIVIGTVGLIVLGVGSFANAGVLVVLIHARRHAGSSVHILIANQSAMDFFACIFGVIGTVVLLTAPRFEYKGNPVVDGTLCMIFEGMNFRFRGNGIDPRILHQVSG